MVWDEIDGVDIGHNVKLCPFTRLDQCSGNQRPAGVLVYHLHADGSVCGGAVHFDVPVNAWEKRHERPLWTVVRFEPLTLSPSIQDTTCSEGVHGHIVDGYWIPC